MVRRATELLPEAERHNSRAAAVCLAIASGPQQQVLRPAEIEAPNLAEALHQEALFGGSRIFFRNLGVESGVDGAALVLEQEGGGRIQIEEDGAISLRLPLEEAGGRRRDHMGFPAIIEETVLARITTGLGALIVHRGVNACYSVQTDLVAMPPFETFADAEGYAPSRRSPVRGWHYGAKGSD